MLKSNIFCASQVVDDDDFLPAYLFGIDFGGGAKVVLLPPSVNCTNCTIFSIVELGMWSTSGVRSKVKIPSGMMASYAKVMSCVEKGPASNASCEGNIST